MKLQSIEWRVPRTHYLLLKNEIKKQSPIFFNNHAKLNFYRSQENLCMYEQILKYF